MVTIVVLIILATISINVVMGEDGLIKQAEKGAQFQANAEASDRDALSEYDKIIENALAGVENGGASQTPEEPENPNPSDPETPTETPLVTTVTSTSHTGTATQDALGNPVYIPGGFKIAEDSGSTVKEGIVIEDGAQNQFVWIPVSNIDGSGNNPIKIDETNSVVITLGRYTFANSSAEVPGAPSIVQKGSDWDKTINSATSELDETYKIVKSSSSYYELATKISGKNEVAKDLEDFIDSVEENHGYYLARYEASYASGSSVSDYKPASKVSTAKSTSSMSYKEGRLWNFISQADASTVCQNMYAGNSYVESDLVNSYAWDTAIVYIQAMGNSNYANQGRGSNTSLKNTGSTGDQKCKIFDMAGNVTEWTTEYGTYVSNPCTHRGGHCYDDSYYTDNRSVNSVGYTGYGLFGFRPLLYCKTGA